MPTELSDHGLHDQSEFRPKILYPLHRIRKTPLPEDRSWVFVDNRLEDMYKHWVTMLQIMKDYPNGISGRSLLLLFQDQGLNPDKRYINTILFGINQWTNRQSMPPLLIRPGGRFFAINPGINLNLTPNVIEQQIDGYFLYTLNN